MSHRDRSSIDRAMSYIRKASSPINWRRTDRAQDERAPYISPAGGHLAVPVGGGDDAGRLIANGGSRRISTETWIANELQAGIASDQVSCPGLAILPRGGNACGNAECVPTMNRGQFGARQRVRDNRTPSGSSLASLASYVDPDGGELRRVDDGPC
jgi:hypothetical protein